MQFQTLKTFVDILATNFSHGDWQLLFLSPWTRDEEVARDERVLGSCLAAGWTMREEKGGNGDHAEDQQKNSGVSERLLFQKLFRKSEQRHRITHRKTCNSK